MNTPAPHIPVLLNEVIAALAPKDGGLYIDGTFGAGGYTKAILDAADCKVIAIDRDPEAIERGRVMAANFPDRLQIIEGRYGDMDRLTAERGIATVDGVALDIGVSSMQIDQAERGFSFAKNGPLDMRMEQSGPSAADVVNSLSEAELADIFYHYGEERCARRIARSIVEERKTKPFVTTLDLAEIVRKNVPRSKDGIHPATRSFQGLRIYVNDELGELRRGLQAAEKILAPDGRLAIVTFHSLEDREVKNFLKNRSGQQARPSRHTPMAEQSGPAPSFTLLSKKPTEPCAEEMARNPRARSARLRVALRTEAPAWPLERHAS